MFIQGIIKYWRKGTPVYERRDRMQSSIKSMRNSWNRASRIYKRAETFNLCNENFRLFTENLSKCSSGKNVRNNLKQDGL